MNTNTLYGKLLDAARSYAAAGICALPAKRAEKRPGVLSWREYQTRLPTAEELTRLFAVRSIDGVCVLAGAISGNLEVIDFDQKAVAYDRWADMVGAELVSRLVVQRTQNGGKHVLYRCEGVIPGNAKLAEDKVDGKTQTLIETRGEGGLVICAPTDGYEVEQGSLLDPPVLTAQERTELMAAAVALGTHRPNVVDGCKLRAFGSDLRPGDDFNARGDLRPVLQKHGWRCTRGGANEHWARPGKAEGTSATFNGESFFVFSSSTQFEANACYTKFYVYAMLEYGGDLAAAAIGLRDEGYGTERRFEVTIGTDSGIENQEVQSVTERIETRRLPEHLRLPPKLLEVPGFISEFIQYCRETCFADQPAIFLAAGIALQGVLAGRKVRDELTNRPNIYTLGIAPTGTGKEWPRVVIMRILRKIGAEHLGGIESPQSGNALIKELSLYPARIAMIDEFGKFMQFNKAAGMHFAKQIVDYLLKLFSEGEGKFFGAQYADSNQRIEVDRPSLSLFGTTVGRSLWENLRVENVTDGLLSRILVIHGEEFPVPGGRCAGKELPESLVEHAQDWFDSAYCYSGGGNMQGKDIQNCPEKVVPTTDAARARIKQLLDEPFDYKEPTEEGRALASRTAQLACKLALVYACSESAKAPVVTLQGVEWANALAEHVRNVMIYIAEHQISESEFDRRCKSVVDWLRSIGGEASRSDYGRKFRRWPKRDREDVLSNLIDAGYVSSAILPSVGRHQAIFRLTKSSAKNLAARP